MCKTKFKANDGTVADISIGDDGEIISVSIDGVKKGTIRLAYVDEPGGHHYYITNLSLDSCKRKGIGRVCLQFHKKTFRAPLTAASPYDPSQQEDGSHLTGDGLPFIQKMREEGVVCRHPDEFDGCHA